MATAKMATPTRFTPRVLPVTFTKTRPTTATATHHPGMIAARHSMITVLIADDQALVRGGFRLIVEAQPDMAVVGEAGDGAEAIALAREHHPDVVLMDVRMPGLDGLQATRAIAHDPGLRDVRVLVLTTFDLDEHVYEAMRNGASGFLLKDVPPESLAAAVRTVATGDALLAPAVLRRIIDGFVRRPAPGSALPAALHELTDRELEVLRRIARGRTNAEIAAELYLSEATVKSHVGHIFTKLDLRDRTQAVILAYETGLVVPGHDAPAPAD
jgi:DNA-binding NarL/FixJ family response regulator